MQTPTLLPTLHVAPDTAAFPGWMPLPGLGVLAANSFLVRAREPVLVDTGLSALSGELLRAISAELALEDLRWIWLTHADPDHTGALHALLEAAPRAKVVTTFLGMGKLGLTRPVPPERVHLLNPGQRLDVGDRTLAALRPPTFDAPETTALLDTRTGALFSSDAFGAVLPGPAEAAEAVSPTTRSEGAILWTTVDAPWLHGQEPAALERALDAVRALAPAVVLSSHLPPARGITEALLLDVAAARTAAPFVGPDQAAIQAMLAAA